jgi:hypothetical protein
MEKIEKMLKGEREEVHKKSVEGEVRGNRREEKRHKKTRKKERNVCAIETERQ